MQCIPVEGCASQTHTHNCALTAIHAQPLYQLFAQMFPHIDGRRGEDIVNDSHIRKHNFW